MLMVRRVRLRIYPKTSMLTLAALLIVLSACNDSATIQDDGPSEVMNPEEQEFYSTLNCKTTYTEILPNLYECNCVETDKLLDTISSGRFLLDSLNDRRYRVGWHVFYLDSTIEKVHFSLVQHDSLIGYADGIIVTNLFGDTVWSQSEFVDVKAPKELALGDTFKVAFNIQSYRGFHSFYSIIACGSKAEIDEVDTRNLPRNRNEINDFRYSFVPVDTGEHSIWLNIEAYSDLGRADSLELTEFSHRHDFVVK